MQQLAIVECVEAATITEGCKLQVLNRALTYLLELHPQNIVVGSLYDYVIHYSLKMGMTTVLYSIKVRGQARDS